MGAAASFSASVTHSLAESFREQQLLDAAFSGDADKCEELIKAGVDVNTRQSTNGCTALHFAAINGCTNAAAVLLKFGADTSLKSYSGKTAKDIAEHLNRDEIIGLFFYDLGSDVTVSTTP